MNTTLTQSERPVWVNVPLSTELRKRVKIEAARREQSSRAFILDAIKVAVRTGVPSKERV